MTNDTIDPRSSDDVRRALLVVFALVTICAGTSGAERATEQRRTRGGADASSVIVLDPSTTILIGADEPPAVQQAARDLASDFEKVLGQKPRLVQRADDAGSVTILIGYRSTLVQALRSGPAGSPESFSMSIRQAAWKGAPRSRVVFLTGADMRGTIYAVYQFAEHYLGIDPLYYWTDRVPARKARVEIPASLNETFPAPVFKYR